jgi:hypothetical protein
LFATAQHRRPINPRLPHQLKSLFSAGVLRSFAAQGEIAGATKPASEPHDRPGTSPDTLKALRNEFSVGVANFDLAQIELVELRLNLRAIANANQDHLIRMQIFFGDGFGVLRGHGV